MTEEKVKPANPETEAKKAPNAKAAAKTGEPEAEKKVGKKKSKSKRRSVVEGNLYVKASFNNTIVTITEPNGETIAWSSAGSSGFKGARKATPYAAQVAAENAIQKAKIYGLEKLNVIINGVGNGREQTLRGVSAQQIEILSITDTTPIPHNGCRKRRVRRV